MRPTVFIHTNDKQMLGAKVAAYSLKKASRNPQAFDVRIIRLEEQPALYGRHGQAYTRKGERLVWDNDDLQSFTPTRFLAPQLTGFQGRAVVIDPDVFAVHGDVGELLARDMHGKAIVCRKIHPKDGRPSYYASSVMLLDCAKLKHWRWEEQIDAMFRGKLDYFQWMNLYVEPEETIGDLEEEWNHFDTLNDETQLIHNTGRLTQPWKTGLAIDFTILNKAVPPGMTKVAKPKTAFKDPRSRLHPRRIAGAVLRRLRGYLASRIAPPIVATAKPAPKSTDGRTYQPHPDPRQEAYFFQLVAECLDAGEVTEEFVREETRRKHVRPDALELAAKHRQTPLRKAS